MNMSYQKLGIASNPTHALFANPKEQLLGKWMLSATSNEVAERMGAGGSRA